VILFKLNEKNDFIEISKNLGRYSSENNFIYVGNSNIGNDQCAKNLFNNQLEHPT